MRCEDTEYFGIFIHFSTCFRFANLGELSFELRAKVKIFEILVRFFTVLSDFCSKLIFQNLADKETFLVFKGKSNLVKQITFGIGLIICQFRAQIDRKSRQITSKSSTQKCGLRPSCNWTCRGEEWQPFHSCQTSRFRTRSVMLYIV